MLRRLARRYLPYELRLWVKLRRRQLDDWRNGLRFARSRGSESDYPYLISSYHRPLINYAGQEHVLPAKKHNLALLASCLSGTVIRPSETFSIWRLAPRPTASLGYAPAAAYRERGLTFEIGGATCLMSTVLYNVGLLGALEIIERHCHSIDLYGEDRYFELGRDASIEYGYLDLRLRNPHGFPVLLTIEVAESFVCGRLFSPVPHEFAVTLAIDSTRSPAGETDSSMAGSEASIVITGRRLVESSDGSRSSEELPVSIHYPAREGTATSSGLRL